MPRSRSWRNSLERKHSKNRHHKKTPQREQKHKRSRQRHTKRSHHRKRRRDYSSPSPSSSPSSSYVSRGVTSSSFDGSSSSVSHSTRQRRVTPHFQYRMGQKLGHKYRVTRLLGTGTFGRVVEGRYEGRQYAIKVIKPVQKYIDSAKTERTIIKDLCNRDPRDEHHLVRYFESLYHYNHYCLVFERLGPSLFDIVKRNDYVGFPLREVQAIARQLFEAVGFIHRNGFTHTDLKLENILVCSSYSAQMSQNSKESVRVPQDSPKIKLIDFGGATHQSQSHGSIINTRQYRCPEVLLQCYRWNQSSDVWSIGCILAELVTGNLLFPVHHDVDHICLIDKLIGRFPRWMAENCEEGLKRYLRQDGTLSHKHTERHIKDRRLIQTVRTLQERIGNAELVHLIRRCLTIDPKERITCEEALKHHFFQVELKEERSRHLKRQEHQK